MRWITRPRAEATAAQADVGRRSHKGTRAPGRDDELTPIKWSAKTSPAGPGRRRRGGVVRPEAADDRLRRGRGRQQESGPEGPRRPATTATTCPSGSIYAFGAALGGESVLDAATHLASAIRHPAEAADAGRPARDLLAQRPELGEPQERLRQEPDPVLKEGRREALALRAGRGPRRRAAPSPRVAEPSRCAVCARSGRPSRALRGPPEKCERDPIFRETFATRVGGAGARAGGTCRRGHSSEKELDFKWVPSDSSDRVGEFRTRRRLRRALGRLCSLAVRWQWERSPLQRHDRGCYSKKTGSLRIVENKREVREEGNPPDVEREGREG